MITLREIADTNWFNKPTFIRKVQCCIFGHRHSDKMMIKKKDGSLWCAWCARYVDRLKCETKRS